MKTMIVYDSFYGNTEKIARAIGAALGAPEEVAVLRAGEVQGERLSGLELLVVGSPTRGFRPTAAVTDLLKRVAPGALNGVRVAAFDTRIALEDIRSTLLRFFVKTGGYAARPIARRLEKSGGTLMAPPEGFLVEGSEGPLKENELARAGEWARGIAAAGKG
jgi:flavodoxin I